VDFFCYHRDRAGSTPLRRQLVEEHWTYMDGFQDRMIARGPTFADDETLTGSVHILSLSDPSAARSFAFEEPGYQAGAYRDVMIRRWDDPSRRTMWDYSSGSDGSERFLVLGFTAGPTEGSLEAPAADSVIVCGSLLSDDGAHALGLAALVEATGADAARATLPEHLVGVEVHRWDFGGRR
jgi:hypothetical protein